MTQNHLQWLHAQIEDWVAEQLISPDQGAALRQRYALPDEPPGLATRIDWGAIVLGVLAALFIGGGCFLIFAYEWDKLSLAWRKILSFLPLILALPLYVYVQRFQRHSVAWQESTVGFLLLMLLSSLGLAYDTFGWTLPGDRLILYWLLLSLPFVYWSNGSLGAIMVMIGTATWAGAASTDWRIAFIGLFALVLPHFWYNWQSVRRQPIRQHLLVWAGLATWTIAWFSASTFRHTELVLLAPVLWLSTFLLLTPQCFGLARPWLARPTFGFGLVGLAICLLFLVNDAHIAPWSQFKRFISDDGAGSWAWLVVLLLLLSIWLWSLWSTWREPAWCTPALLALGLMPVVVIAYMIIYRTFPDDYSSNPPSENNLAMIFASAYGLLLGGLWVAQGLRDSRLSDLNLGMAFLLMVAASRFFDSNWDPLVKGLGFVVLGSGFLVVNWWWGKKMRGGENF